MLKMEIRRSSVRTETTIKSTDMKMTKRKRRTRIRGMEATTIKILRKRRVKAEKRTLGT